MAEATEPPRHVLVVDDEPDLMDELTTALSLDGWVAEGATDARTALDCLAGQDGVTVLLTDIRMPGTDGLELARQAWERRDETKALEVVLLTGHATIEEAAKAVRIGAFDFITKPIGLDKLREVVDRAHESAIRRRRSEAERIGELDRLRAEREMLRRELSKVGDTSDFSAGVPRELSSVLSHELRTPLIALMAVPELLSTGANLPAAEVADNLNVVRESGARLMQIAEDFVEFLAPPDPATLQFRPVPALMVLQRVQAAFLDSAVPVALGDAANGSVETDLPRLVKALGRLVTNAVAWTPAGGTVRLSAAAEGANHVAFQVADDGPGLTQAEIAVALQPFRQVDMSLARPVGGLGLGLPLAARMADRLGGLLRLESEKGAGLRAAIVLPRRHQASRMGQDG